MESTGQISHATCETQEVAFDEALPFPVKLAVAVAWFQVEPKPAGNFFQKFEWNDDYIDMLKLCFCWKHSDTKTIVAFSNIKIVKKK